ncbi:hypothetical protein [Niabella beijingensis]|uniref:hypothetical protein n=1 Tax=Niabella beijingensis TaxID=2872700 RepID=UPI001CBBA348|nr:hypothetical protein [Niabella beijingensis]MBZ4191896.1 hypothetical protein [Niabella beijingensis]
MKKTIPVLLIFLLFFSGLSGQNNYDNIVYKINGDLNGDQKADRVIVKEDTSSRYHPYLLEIFFQDQKGNYKKVLTSTKAVMPRHPEGDARTVTILENLEIRNGILIFSNQLIRGNLTHKFRFQKGHFKLIGYQSVQALAGYIAYIDYNLSTGNKVTIKKAYETDKVIGEEKTTEKQSALPTLQDFSPPEVTY